MFTEYTAQVAVQQRERELTERLERRRVEAERAVAEHGGERLAFVAYLARQSRAARSVGSRPKAVG
ncbi:hypothetical protein GEV29_16240 [Aeromicrobium sp. SMF47]|uniref:Uncharacterized protein n=1 Tax=Aeromicrobium yanjiei TaxID=2662028 RepID=A0A5Q2MCM2_9ACTN|nr:MULTISPECIES: hypothetical protein [Aeromicrobium]MRJ78088.1 hypothetical protein [Aeromicrobium yanjiei]MRK03284.1 hypothetical protein [Aeromicrobium sp. S22]QGG40837.1 hypothetical protein GEV26_05390 [Aeromicrobium yanjiei]